MDTHLRTIAKSLTWRLGGLIVTMVVVLAITGEVKLAASVGVADTLVKLLAYYVHERIWLKVKLGQKPRPEYEI